MTASDLLAGDDDVIADVVEDYFDREAFTETGFVCLFPITVNGMLFDESITLDVPWGGAPRGWHPSLRQIEEWTAEIRRENASVMRDDVRVIDERSLLADMFESLASEWVA